MNIFSAHVPMHVFIAVPCYGGTVHGQCTLSLMKLYHALLTAGIAVTVRTVLNDSLITRARNLLVHWFLQTDATHLLFVDADIEFRAEDVVKMLGAGVDVIGGLYAKKELPTKPVVVPDVVPDANGPPTPVDRIGTGLLLTSRRTFETMRTVHRDEPYDQLDVMDVYPYFDCARVGREYLSEDWYFCQRWCDMGGTVYAAPWTATTHYGSFGYPIHTSNQKKL
jgi:hypothetical protein